MVLAAAMLLSCCASSVARLSAPPDAPRVGSPATKPRLSGAGTVWLGAAARADRLAAAEPASDADVPQVAPRNAGQAPQAADFLLGYRRVLNRFGQGLSATVAAGAEISAVPGALSRWLRSNDSAGGIHGWVGLACILAGGFLVELVVRSSLLQPQAPGPPAREDAGPSPHDRLSKVGRRAVRGIARIVAFQCGALGTYVALARAGPELQVLALGTITALTVTRLLCLASRIALSPASAADRLVALSDVSARRMHILIVTFGALGAFGQLLVSLLSFAGVSPDLLSLVVFVLWTGVSLALAAAASVARLPGRDPACDDGETSRADRSPRWRSLALVGIALLYLVTAALGLSGRADAWVAGLLTLSLVLILPFIDAVLGAGLPARCDREAGPWAREEDTAHRLLASLRRWLPLLLTAIGFMAAAAIWNIPLFPSASSESWTARLARATVDITITFLLASLAWGLTKALIDRRIRPDAGAGATAGPQESNGEEIVPASRTATLLALFRVFALTGIVCAGLLVSLTALGVNVMPLLAGAGIVGVAIGFGSQTLIKDIVSGLFFLLDDAVRLGEYIQVGNLEGAVEKISIRSLRLRHPRGRLHTIPYGEIRHLTNYSRDWAIMKLELRVPFDADLELIRKVIKGVGETLLQDPEHGPKFLQPAKSQGVRRMEETAMIIGVKYMTYPMEQFTMRRVVFQSIQQAFAEKGIAFARPRIILEQDDHPAAENRTPEQPSPPSRP
ncbi:mechanosensitive ion channel family protein [Methylobacterium sp. JK268]